ncbi:MAG: heavy metal-binding domain-containing protein, partial [Polyangiales bacterium]
MNTTRRKAFAAAALLITFVVGITVGAKGCDEKSGEQASLESGHAGHEQAAVWTCSMHPQIRMDEPGQCPICGMDLIPGAPSYDEDEGEHVSTRGELVKLSPRSRALAAIETAVVARTSSRAEIRLLGRIDLDETRIRTVTPWTAGRI